MGKNPVLDGDPVIAGMAAIPSRHETLREVAETLLPQVHRLFICANGWDSVPGWARVNKKVVWHPADRETGDRGKFMFSETVDTRHYYLAVDDDLLYPRNYVRETIGLIERYGRQAVVSWHGKALRIPGPWTSYFRGAIDSSFACLRSVERDRLIHVPGTGVLAYHTDTIRPDVSQMTPTNMADIHMGRICNEAGIPVVVGAHREGWIRHADIDHSTTLWQRFLDEGDRIQTRVLNAVDWKPLNHDFMRRFHGTGTAV